MGRKLSYDALQSDDFDAHEIASVVKSAYAHVAEHSAQLSAGKGSKRTKSPVDPLRSDAAEAEEEENDDGEALREHTPTFPDSVFTSLSDLLHAGLKYVSNKRERDILLLEMITVVSFLLHTGTALPDDTVLGKRTVQPTAPREWPVGAGGLSALHQASWADDDAPLHGVHCARKGYVADGYGGGDGV